MAGCVMGVDGGGTQTEYVLVDIDSGERIGSGKLGALSPFSGEKQLARTAGELSYVINHSEAACAAVRVGCAGAGESNMAQKVHLALSGAGITSLISVVGDHENALTTAFGDEDGAVLISGTGSICCARCAGRLIRAGGRGHVFDDGGSGYAIGRDMLAAVARAADGRGSKTKLSDIVRDFSGLSEIGELASHYSDPARPKGDIAALAQMLGMAVSFGDETARRIQDKAGDELSQLAIAVLAQLKPECQRLAFMGSVLIGNRLLRMRVKELIARQLPEAESYVLHTRAAEGAAAYALKALKSGSWPNR